MGRTKVSAFADGDGVDRVVFSTQNRAVQKKSKKKEAVAYRRLCGTCLDSWFKYLTFFLTNVQALFHVPSVVPQIVLPIGISFYTFQLLSYVVDVYRGEVQAQKKYWMLLLYAGLFHQCIAGPIVRYEYVADELENRSARLPLIGKGIRRFFVGLAKKAVLANSCASIADSLLPSITQELAGIPAAGLWVGMLMYMLQIYLDFSAYSDIPVGL